MAKVELHQLSDYHLRTGSLDIATNGGTIAYIPIPQSGIVKRISACIEVLQTSLNAFITFEVSGSKLKLNGVTATLNLPIGGSVGNVHTIEFDAPTSNVYEAEDGDALADGSVLEISTNASGDDGFASFTVTIGR